MARPRNQNAARTASGQISRAAGANDIGPTHQTQQKHLERAQRYHIPADKEAGYAESTIGILEARGIISIEQAELCKKLATLRSVLFGTGNARCSSAENVSRGLPNDGESKSMRETWTAYKAAVDCIEPANRRLFEHVVLRNNYRDWMKMGDSELFACVDPATITADDDAPVPDNWFRHSQGRSYIYAKRRELRTLLGVMRLINERFPADLKDVRAATKTGYTQMSEAQRNALDGDEKLCELYANKRSER